MLEILAQYGPNWCVLLLIILLLWRAMGKQYKSFRDDQSRVHRFFERSVSALDNFGTKIIENQSTILVTIGDSNRSSTDKILGVIAEMNAESNAATGGIILALKIKENKTVEAIEKLLVALREDLVTSRAQPPSGAVGSQVRDGGASVAR